MNFTSFRKSILLLFAIFYSCSAVLFAETIAGKVQTGSQELKDYRYPVSLYVPDNFDASKTYPLLVALPDVDTDPAPYLAEWTQVGKAKNYIILVPTLKIRISEVSVQADQWLLKVKKDITERYNVDPSRVLLTGKKQGSHYAAYLGVRYPGEFSAVALMGQAWPGPLGSIMELKNSANKQLPFFAALDEADESYYQAAELFAGKMTDKGYPVYLQKAKKEDFDLIDIKKQALAWFDEKRETWARQVAESNKTWKAKFSKAYHEFFAVQ